MNEPANRKEPPPGPESPTSPAKLCGEVAWNERERVLRIARGIQNKVLEALAAGKPFVVSSQGLEGIEAKVGQDVIKAETPGQWVESITQLFDSPEQRNAIGRSGRAFVEREYCWSSQLEQLRTIPGLKNLLSTSQGKMFACR